MNSMDMQGDKCIELSEYDKDGIDNIWDLDFRYFWVMGLRIIFQGWQEDKFRFRVFGDFLEYSYKISFRLLFNFGFCLCEG